MHTSFAVDAELANNFVLIGTPVGHSLSPAMHNAVYRAADVNWGYSAIECPDEQSAMEQIYKVRTGEYKGMNITMPYKQLALREADYVDPSADVAGGANVLVRRGFELHAFNTDGMGAAGAIAREGGIDLKGKRACVCGTGPTSCAIAVALLSYGVGELTVFSRDMKKAQDTVDRIRLSMDESCSNALKAGEYAYAWQIVPGVDVFVDATPRGMKADDEPIVDPNLFHEGQVVLDVVYAHGVTRLLEGAAEQGAVALDGLEMLVEQAALAIEIWQHELGYEFEVNRDIMRHVARPRPWKGCTQDGK